MRRSALTYVTIGITAAAAGVLALTEVRPSLPDVQMDTVQLTTASGGIVDLLTPGADTTTEGATAALPTLDTDASGLNFDVSFNGTDLFHMGDATATSGPGDLAIAFGDGATATAGVYSVDGNPFMSSGDFAFASGAGSTAVAVEPFNSATAIDGGTADAGFLPPTTAVNPGEDPIFGGRGDSAYASGTNSLAAAGDGNGDSASVSGTDSAAFAGHGDSDTASVFPLYGVIPANTSTAIATYGNHDSAYTFGSDDTALAGGTSEDALGNNDFAAAFGVDTGTIADATGGSNLFVVEPSLFGDSTADAAAGAAPSDDFGLGALLNDLGSWLGL